MPTGALPQMACFSTLNLVGLLGVCILVVFLFAFFFLYTVKEVGWGSVKFKLQHHEKKKEYTGIE